MIVYLSRLDLRFARTNSALDMQLGHGLSPFLQTDISAVSYLLFKNNRLALRIRRIAGVLRVLNDNPHHLRDSVVTN